jgi:hypothetical protein
MFKISDIVEVEDHELLNDPLNVLELSYGSRVSTIEDASYIKLEIYNPLFGVIYSWDFMQSWAKRKISISDFLHVIETSGIDMGYPFRTKFYSMMFNKDFNPIRIDYENQTSE